MAANTELHEDPEKLSSETVDRHRAIVSLMEELEAVDWYDQRIEAAEDDELRSILAHNRDEEKEHAAMLIEWLRRKDPSFQNQLKEYTFSQGRIAAEEGEEEGLPTDAADVSLGIGSLRKEGRS